MYKGKFKLKNPKKYKGNVDNIIYRSSWEFSVMMWCDSNPQITEWSSEELIIPYLCPTDNSWHRYFLDFVIKFASGKVYWIELKPEKYTKIPESRTKKRMSKTYIKEVFQYTKNQAKWKTANIHAEKSGAIFQIWTETTLKSLGIKILGK
jgi:hypothetical protein